ncbi:LysR family substrate-binding domain-containing protein [Streptomyces albidoflavus]|uniref:LysR family substrate-binding domain-containing protein n=1 Tax=Streptomyces albidoflavus TaxID=1886 RepID=UPI000743F0F6|nr:LysR family substrate-binding domain-containing protein [Streptomyces albidoflavus]KUL56155.1 LysR family transcriptional regulator [Streptomyces albidoflavus]WTD99863.1 LysR family substrate-binding domain-containing protein [Streptomyces albidoflavus]SCD36181.1 LysR substrate binding domain-containing protein [Streptomyces sp. IgraMP-1]
MTSTEDRPAADASPSFRLAFVPGVTPGKWVRIWQERFPAIPLTLVQVPAPEATALLRAGGADAALLRMPVDGEDLSAIPLYTETTVVVVPRDHLLTAVDEVPVEELAEELVLHPLDDPLEWEHPPGLPAIERPATTADAIELVAAGVGLVAVPQSLARLHHRRDLTFRPLLDVPASRVALSWPEEHTTDLVDAFIGIVRGRTANSTRGRLAATPGPAKPKGKGADAKSAPHKAAAKSGSGGKGARGTTGGPKGTKGGKASGGAKGAKGAKRGKPRRRS